MLMLIAGSANTGPRSANVVEKQTKANATIQIHAKPSPPFPPPRSGFVQQSRCTEPGDDVAVPNRTPSAPGL